MDSKDQCSTVNEDYEAGGTFESSWTLRANEPYQQPAHEQMGEGISISMPVYDCG